MSSASIMSSSSELLPDESEPIIFMLPKELDTFIRSAFAIVDHKEFEFMPLFASEFDAKCRPFFRFGIFMARPLMVGDESGDDASARVE